jgi:two-component system phosphate regulon sensor histidine kinase PhoR
VAWLSKTWEITLVVEGWWLALLLLAALLVVVLLPIGVNALWAWRYRRSRRVTADFASLVDALPLGVLVAAPSGRIAIVNARAAELWPSLVAGQTLPADLRRLAGADDAVMSGSLTGPDGRRLAARVFALTTRHGRGREWLITLDDAVRRQQEADAASALVRQISHELKTPLSVIRGHASRFAADGSADQSEARRAWAVVDDEATRLTGLIDQAILMARLETAEPLVQRRPLNLRAVCEEVVIDLAERIAEQGGDLDLEVDDGDYTVEGDRAALRQMLLNLIDNAAKYGGPGVRIAIALRLDAAPGRIRLTVHDNGPGIASADLPLIFEKGFRGQQSRGSRAGSGLGLALVRSIVDWHGGTVGAESQSGQGTSIVIELPRRAGKTPGGSR